MGSHDKYIISIDQITINSEVATNILDFDYSFVIQDQVRHTPNITAGIGIRNYPKWHIIGLTFDSWTDILDSYIRDEGVNPNIPSGSIKFTYVDEDGTVSTETWTLQANRFRVMKSDELRVEKLREHKTWEVILIGRGTITIS